MTTTYVTVAIPYVNSAPHLGYAYELVLADVFARSRRQSGDDVRFLGGTDDHALKNVLAAEAAGVDSRAFVDAHAAEFEQLGPPLRLSLDDFIRTSADERHRPAVERLWRACASRGDLYQRNYAGQYCVGCEQFYDATDAPDGCCPEHGTTLEHVVEENWFFRLSRYQDLLDHLISSGALAVHPAPFRDEVLSFVRRGLEDISVSRSARRARGWGLAVPDDPSQVIYVWFDALANYLSALRYGEPQSPDHQRWWVESDERVHVVGKGILRFHAVYWPAFLASAGEPLPTRIQVHPYLTVGGEKLSKSGPITVDPRQVVDDLGADALRWWFARDVSPVADTDYTVQRLVARANEDLANGLGNVTNRIVTLVHRLRDGKLPEVAAAPVSGVVDIERDVAARIAEFDLRGATSAVNAAVAALNRDLETTKPWRLAGSAAPDEVDTLDLLLTRHVASARTIARAVRPIVPDLAARLLAQLSPTPLLPDPKPAYVRIASGVGSAVAQTVEEPAEALADR
jgi:methionyl-tRNA synthetase